MNEQELLSFIDYYNQKLDQLNYDLYVESKNQDNDFAIETSNGFKISINALLSHSAE